MVIVTGSCVIVKKSPTDEKKLADSMSETQYYKMFTDATKDVLLYSYYKNAIPLYNECIHLFPERAAPYYQLSSIYLKKNDIILATKYAEKALSLDSLNIWYLFHLANVYQIGKDYENAAKIYRRILTIRDDDEILFNLAIVYSQKGRNNDALEVVSLMDKENIESREVMMLKHSIYNEMRRYDSAVYELEKIKISFPEDISAYGMLAEYLTEIGRRNYARKVYKEILEIDSTSGIAILSFADFYLRENSIDSAFHYLKIAFCYSDLTLDEKISVIVGYINNTDFLKKNYILLDELLEIIKKEDRKFSFYAAKSDLFINLEEYEKALPYLDSSLIYEKNNFMLWEQTIIINNYLKRDNDIIKLTTKCLEYFKDKPNIYFFRANAYTNINEYELAIYDIDSILINNPEVQLKVQALNLGAEIYRKINDHNKSDFYFEEILKINPENLIIRNNYAYYLSLRDVNIKKAEELSKLTIEREPFNATYLDTYGWILYRMGNYKQAKSYVEKAIRNGAFDNAEVLEHYGDIMGEMNNCNEAKEAYQKAIEILYSTTLEEKIKKTTDCK